MILFAIRFAAELAGFAAVGFMASTLTDASPWNVVLGVAVAAAFVVAWAVVVAPTAANPIPQGVRDLIGTALLLLVAGALAAVGQSGVAAALAAVVFADQALLILVRPERPGGIRAAGPRG